MIFNRHPFLYQSHISLYYGIVWNKIFRPGICNHLGIQKIYFFDYAMNVVIYNKNCVTNLRRKSGQHQPTRQYVANHCRQGDTYYYCNHPASNKYSLWVKIPQVQQHYNGDERDKYDNKRGDDCHHMLAKLTNSCLNVSAFGPALDNLEFVEGIYANTDEGS